jgi:hypothetical protein
MTWPPTLPPNDPVVGQDNHTPDHDKIRDALEAIILKVDGKTELVDFLNHYYSSDPHPNDTAGSGLSSEQVMDLLGLGGLVAGTNVTLDYNDAANTLTINSSGSGAMTREEVEDLLQDSFIAGSGITVAYSDAGNSFTITNSDRGSVAVSGHTGTGTGAHAASAVSYNSAGGINISGSVDDAQDAIGTLDFALGITNSNVTNHLADPTDAHDASAISTVTGSFNNNLSAADDTVQKALDTIDNLALGGAGVTTGVKGDINVVNATTDWQIVGLAVGTAELAANAVTTAKITDSNVTTAKIADDAVTAAKIATNAVGASELADNAVDTAAIAADAVTNDKLTNMAYTTIKGRVSVGLGDPEDLTPTQVAGLLPSAAASVKGLVTPPGGTTTFLRADGSFAAPPGGSADGNLRFQNNDFTPNNATGSNGDMMVVHYPDLSNVWTTLRLVGPKAAGVWPAADAINANGDRIHLPYRSKTMLNSDLLPGWKLTFDTAWATGAAPTDLYKDGTFGGTGWQANASGNLVGLTRYHQAKDAGMAFFSAAFQIDTLPEASRFLYVGQLISVGGIYGYYVRIDSAGALVIGVGDAFLGPAHTTLASGMTVAAGDTVVFERFGNRFTVAKTSGAGRTLLAADAAAASRPLSATFEETDPLYARTFAASSFGICTTSSSVRVSKLRFAG